MPAKPGGSRAFSLRGCRSAFDNVPNLFQENIHEIKRWTVMTSPGSSRRHWMEARHFLAVAQLDVRRLRLALLLRRFNPSQPRLPAGQPGGGRWTNGGGSGEASVEPVNWRPRQSGGTRVIRGQVYETTAGQEVRLAIAEARANALIREVRRRDPNWRPRESIHQGVEGEILATEAQAEQAFARLRELRAQEPVCRPVGQTYPFSTGARGDSSDRIHTVSPSEFRELLTQITPQAEAVPSPRGYLGQWYRQPDGSVFGVRWSERYGVTVDVIRSTNPLVSPGHKAHQQ